MSLEKYLEDIRSKPTIPKIVSPSFKYIQNTSVSSTYGYPSIYFSSAPKDSIVRRIIFGMIYFLPATSYPSGASVSNYGGVRVAFTLVLANNNTVFRGYAEGSLITGANDSGMNIVGDHVDTFLPVEGGFWVNFLSQIIIFSGPVLAVIEI